MKRLLPAFVFVALVVYGMVAFAGGPKAAKRVIAPETETAVVANNAVVPADVVKPHQVRKTSSVLEQVIGSTYYSYGWNSGGPRHVEWYKDLTGASRVYMIYITRAGDTWAGTRQITYVAYDGTTFSAPAAAVPPTTQATYFSGISVWRGGAADGLAGIGAGWAGAGNSYYALESAAGAGGFTTTQVTNMRDVQVTNINDAGTVVLNHSGGGGDRAGNAFMVSTDFGTTWADASQDLMSGMAVSHTIGALEPPIVAQNGNLYVLTDATGTGQIPPLGTATADSANLICLFKSTDLGTTWTNTVITPDGNEYNPRHFSLFSNFEQFDLAVDNAEKAHVVMNAYNYWQFNTSSQDSTQPSIDCVYWDATHGYKSLVSFDRTDPFLNEVINKRDGNSLGCSYPSIATSADGQKIVCTWSQPNWTGTTIDTTATGVISQNIWYNASFDGGATWNGAVKLTTTTGFVEEYSNLAEQLEDLPGGGVRAKVLFLRMDFSNTGTSGNPGEAVYVEFDIAGGAVNNNPNKPFEFTLDQNYPNPFNPSTMISYTLPTATDVKLSVFNVLGQEVATVVNEFQTAGSHSVNFSSANLASGVYFYTIKAGNFSDTKKMTFMK